MHGGPGQGSHLMGHSQDGQTVGTVGGYLKVNDLVAHVVGKGGAHWGVIGKDNDTGMVITYTQLYLRADHTFRYDTTNTSGFQRLYLPAVGIEKLRPDLCEGDFLILRHVGSATDYLYTLAANVHCTQSQAVGVGVRLYPGHIAHVAVLPAADCGDFRHLNAGHSDAMGQFLNRYRYIAVFFEPGQGDFHCSASRSPVHTIHIGLSI